MTPKAGKAFAVEIPFTRGDIDCGLTLFCQISGTVLGVITALETVLSSPFKDSLTEPEQLSKMKDLINSIVYGKIISGMCVTMTFGTFYYGYMAVRLMRKYKRNDVCCLPYGVNTPAAFAFVFNIVAKAAQTAAAKGMTYEEGITYAWRVGCVANLVAGTIATLVGFAGPHIVKVAPKAALLIALAGIGFTWLGIGQVIVCYKAGHVGLLPLGIAIAGFFSGIKTSPVPTSIVVMLVGAAAGWGSGMGWPEGEAIKVGGTWEAVTRSTRTFSFYAPHFLDAASFAAIPEVMAENMSIILPVSLTGAVNTLVSVYASHETGDVFPIRESLVVDGLTTVAAALFGSPLGTCVYIGHPQFKAQGARFYYTIYSWATFCLLAVTGLFATVNAFVPPYAIAPIILFVGLAINKEAFGCTPEHQVPAAVLGLFPPVADWVVSKWPHGQKPPPELAAIAHGALLVGLLWTSIGVQVIQRRFKHAAIWAAIAAVMSALGLIHQAKADLTFKTFTKGVGGFGTSACAFAVGYMSQAFAFGLLALVQAKGSSRVPPPRVDHDDAADAEELGHSMGRVRSDNTSIKSAIVPMENEGEHEAFTSTESSEEDNDDARDDC